MSSEADHVAQSWYDYYFIQKQTIDKPWPSGSRPVMFADDPKWAKIQAKQLAEQRKARPFDFPDLFDTGPLTSNELNLLSKAFAVSVDLLKGSGNACAGPISPLLLVFAQILRDRLAAAAPAPRKRGKKK